MKYTPIDVRYTLRVVTNRGGTKDIKGLTKREVVSQAQSYGGPIQRDGSLYIVRDTGI